MPSLSPITVLFCYYENFFEIMKYRYIQFGILTAPVGILIDLTAEQVRMDGGLSARTLFKGPLVGSSVMTACESHWGISGPCTG